jgi:hypothetical protein
MGVQAFDRDGGVMVAEQDVPDRMVLDGAGGEEGHG